MKTIWLALLERAIRALLGVDWNFVKERVAEYWNDAATGSAKRDLVISNLKMVGCVAAEWIMKIAIEKAYEEVKQERLK